MYSGSYIYTIDKIQMDSYTMEEYSSGCESGWTVYFKQSRGYVDDDQGCANRSREEEEEEEDLSMVSDASSGPAQVSQDNNTNANCNTNGGMFYSISTTDEDGALVRNKQQLRRSTRKGRPGEKRVDFNQDHMLDDTASSRPDFNYSSVNYDDQAASSVRKMMDLSQDHFSTSYFQAGGASSSAMRTHNYDHQMHFHRQYNW